METIARRSRTGLILGRFLPPHRGHLFLVDHARSRVESLTIAVCTLANEPIPGETRYRWMKELCPGARVVHVTDLDPSRPGEAPGSWEIWTARLLAAAGGVPDILFTSERYGEEMARRLGARHVCVDPGRARYPVSGTAIRNDPMGNWSFLPPSVRPWFVRKVALTGSECTGKTTLAAELAARYRTVWSPEYARSYVDAKAAPLDATDVEPIARGQMAGEDEAARRAERLLVLDTDLLSTVVYARHYYGSCPEWIERAAAERRAHLYLLHHPDVPWIADGLQRDRAESREEMHAVFRRALQEAGARAVDIFGTWSERSERARVAIDELISRAR